MLYEKCTEKGCINELFIVNYNGCGELTIGKNVEEKQINPFTLRFTLESIVCYSYTFKNNWGIKQMLTKYLKES